MADDAAIWRSRLREPLARNGRPSDWPILFGFLWGFGNLTYGMAARYSGHCTRWLDRPGVLHVLRHAGAADSQGNGRLGATPSGWAILAGIALCAFGIVLCGEAGRRRDMELKASRTRTGGEKFQFGKGICVAIVAGILSACFAFGLDRGEPIAEISLSKGHGSALPEQRRADRRAHRRIRQQRAQLPGDEFRNKHVSATTSASTREYFRNLLLVWVAGVTWFCQFFFYGMGQTKLGEAISILPVGRSTWRSSSCSSISGDWCSTNGAAPAQRPSRLSGSAS